MHIDILRVSVSPTMATCPFSYSNVISPSYERNIWSEHNSYLYISTLCNKPFLGSTSNGWLADKANLVAFSPTLRTKTFLLPYVSLSALPTLSGKSKHALVPIAVPEQQIFTFRNTY